MRGLNESPLASKPVARRWRFSDHLKIVGNGALEPGPTSRQICVVDRVASASCRLSRMGAAVWRTRFAGLPTARTGGGEHAFKERAKYLRVPI